MSISFDKDKGFIADSVDKVREDVQQVWINAFKSPDLPALNTAPETPQGQLIDAQTAAIMNKDNEVLFLANQFNPATATLGCLKPSIFAFSSANLMTVNTRSFFTKSQALRS